MVGKGFKKNGEKEGSGRSVGTVILKANQITCSMGIIML